jgi:hypothetical protein
MVIPTTTSVLLHIVPDKIVSVVPQFRGHLHFVAADQRVVIVDPWLRSSPDEDRCKSMQ